jgi:hypothetical protein
MSNFITEWSCGYLLFAFGIVALARDYLGYRWAWRFLSAADLDLWPITRPDSVEETAGWTIAKPPWAMGSIILIVVLKLWDVGANCPA